MRTQSRPALAAPGISAGRLRLLTFILATASGVSVANIFYSQPLLDLIARSYHTTEGSAAIVVTVTQGNLVLSQQEIYQLRPNARARINTAFIGRVFGGGAIGSALSGLAYSRGGWAGVSVAGVILSLIGLGVWCGSELLRRGRHGRLTARCSLESDRSLRQRGAPCRP